MVLGRHFQRATRNSLGLCLLFSTVALSNQTEQENTPVQVVFDQKWLFKIDPEQIGTNEKWFSPDSDRTGWDSVRVPGSWEVYAGMERYDGHGWFAKQFHLNSVDTRLSIHFGGVDDDAIIWVNGIEVGTHDGYSEPFAVDVSKAVHSGENLLIVRVVDHGGGGGIYSSVTLVDSDLVPNLLKGAFHDKKARESADWVRDAVIYEVYVRSFSKDGTFRALEQRIPELKELGVTVLWLMPIHPVGLVGRKGSLGSPYAVRDYHDVNPEFGTMDDFRSLVNAIHAQGMKLIIDLVINHTAWDNQLITEHPDWYTKDSAGNIIPPNSDWSDVADLDYSNQGLREWMSDMMEFWVRDVHIDGYRCDVAELVPTDFWEDIRKRLEGIKPVMMLSEGSLPEHHVSAFDLTYSWNIYDALGPLLSGAKPASFLDMILQSESLRFPQGSQRLRFNTNHDKNAWDAPAVTKFGLDGLKLATVLVNTIPGIPLIYAGEEVGNDKRLDLFEKVEVDWSKPRTIGALSHTLFSLRRDGTALTRGTMTRLETQADSDLYAFLRSSDKESIIVVLNFSREKRECNLRFPEALAGKAVRLVDVFNEKVQTIPAGTPTASFGMIEGLGFRVFRIQ